MPYEKIGKNEPVCIADEVPFEIPESWEWVRLGTVMLNRDAERIPLSVNERSKLQKIYDYYGASGIIDKVDRYLFSKPLLLIGEDGANLLLRSKPIAFIAQGKYWVNNHAHVLDAIGGIQLEYVATYINAINLSPYVTGTAQPKMNQEKMNSILVPIPPVEEQNKIIKKLNLILPLVDDYGIKEKELAQYNSKISELLKKSILQEAVQGKLVPQDSSDEPASVLLERIRAKKERLIQEGKIKRDKHESVIYRRDNSHYEKRGAEDVCIDEEIPFEVPSSWALIRLNDIGIYKKGPFGSSLTKSMFVPKGTDTVKVYEQKNAIQKDHTLGTYYITHQYYESKMKSFTVEPGDILVSCAGTIGETYVLPEQIELGIINQALMRMTIYAPIDLDYFLLYFDYVLKQTAKESSKGSAIKNIPPFKIFKKLILPLPPLEEQKRIVAKVRELKKLCNLLCP